MTAHYKLWYALPLLLQVVIAGCGGSAAPPAGTPPGTPPAPTTGTDCGDGLAAEDLSGECRATPQATMGALEAISRGPDTDDANA